MNPTSWHLMVALDMQAMAARNERNFERKAVFDDAVKIVALRSVGVPLKEVQARVAGRLQRQSLDTQRTAAARSYYREAAEFVTKFAA